MLKYWQVLNCFRNGDSLCGLKQYRNQTSYFFFGIFSSVFIKRLITLLLIGYLDKLSDHFVQVILIYCNNKKTEITITIL
ncbi:hypothetical protein pb186bvf_020755 [Paramecium bursaria]